MDVEGKQVEEQMQERARQTRAAILRGAGEAFAEQGYAAATMNDIAVRAGVTRGALSFHFPAKAAIAVALIQMFDQRRVETVARIEPESPGLVRIWQLLEALASASADDATIQAASRLQLERNVIDAPLPPPFVGWIDSFTALYADAAARGELRDGVEPATLGWMTAATFFGVQHVSNALTARSDLLQRIGEFWTLFLPAIQAPPPS